MADLQVVQWESVFQPQEVAWQSERGAKQPTKLAIVDDTTPADKAYRLACEGVGLLWQGDYHNGRQLLTAMAKRLDQRSKAKLSKGKSSAEPVPSITDLFHQHRQAQAQRANVLNRLLVRIKAGGELGLRRAPVVHDALLHAWGRADQWFKSDTVVSLRELLGLIGAYQWHINGVFIPALNEKIHPSYGVFSPVRGEYVTLVNQAPLPSKVSTAWDIGTGTGVLSAVLAKRGVPNVIAVDLDPRAIECAQANLAAMCLSSQVKVNCVDMFPQGKADLIVCNPPWLPGKASAPIERAIYDENHTMLLAFLHGVAEHLTQEGEAWLVLSDLAELLGLRERGWLEHQIEAGGLTIGNRLQAKPNHDKAQRLSDPLYPARSRETTYLYQLRHA